MHGSLNVKKVVWRLSMYISFLLFCVRNVVGKPTQVRNLSDNYDIRKI